LRRLRKWRNEFLKLIVVTYVYNKRLCVGLSTTSRRLRNFWNCTSVAQWKEKELFVSTRPGSSEQMTFGWKVCVQQFYSPRMALWRVELLFRDEIKSKVSHALLIMFAESSPNSAEYTQGSVGTY
jgi:hypothetical protein